MSAVASITDTSQYTFHVLHVDDEPDFLDLTSIYIEREDDRFAVETVTSANQGLDRLAEQRFDCIISDYDMPGCNGIEFLEMVREENPDLPFILFTGKGTEEIASDAISAGVTDYLQKETGTDQYTVLANLISNAIEHYRSELKVEQRDQRLRDIVGRVTDALVEVDSDWQFTLVNQQAEELYEMDQEYLLGRDFWEVFHEAQNTRFEDEYRQVMETREPTAFVEYFSQLDGWFDIQAYPKKDGGIAFYFVEITEKIERERELERKNDLLEQVFVTSPAGVVILTLDGHIQRANSQAVQVLGLSKSEITDRTYDDPEWNLVDTAGDPISEDELPFARVLETGEPVYDFEHGISGPDGTQRWISVNAAPLSADNGEIERVVAVVEDVSARGGRERALREVYDIMSNRKYSFEEQIGALLEFGRTELGTEYGSLSEIQGDDYVFEVVAADDDSIQAGDLVPVSTTICELAASSERTIVLGDIERDAPEATDRALYADWGIASYLGAPVLVDDDVYGTFCFYDTEAKADQFTEWEVTLIDLMSRWVSYELQRRQLNAQLLEKNEQLEQFAGIISHDLRNPLNVAHGRLDLMADDCDSEHFSQVSQALDRMEALIEDMLSMAQEETSEPSIQSVELESMFDGCWGNVETGDVKLTNDLEGTIEADEGRLRQLFENLIRNAIQHGGKNVSVRVGHLNDGFYVEDTGPGIPEETRNKVFEAGHSSDGNGNGLGLSIVKQVAEVHGWSLDIASGETGGARFEVTGTGLTAG